MAASIQSIEQATDKLDGAREEAAATMDAVAQASTSCPSCLPPQPLHSLTPQPIQTCLMSVVMLDLHGSDESTPGQNSLSQYSAPRAPLRAQTSSIRNEMQPQIMTRSRLNPQHDKCCRQSVFTLGAILVQAAAAFTGLVNVTIASNDTLLDSGGDEELTSDSGGRQDVGTAADKAASSNALALGQFPARHFNRVGSDSKMHMRSGRFVIVYTWRQSALFGQISH